jgi:hypothetical protein
MSLVEEREETKEGRRGEEGGGEEDRKRGWGEASCASPA